MDERHPPSRYAPLGLNAPGSAVGLSGLYPLEVVVNAPIVLRRAPGVARVRIDLPAGCALSADKPLVYRLRGDEAGLEFEGDGEIVALNQVRLPVEFPYALRMYPEPPESGEFSLELSFHWSAPPPGPARIPQDVQWRQPITWSDSGAREFELRYAQEL